ncbi:unnamed protein product [Moneuplotes crassus]|uniref:Uncharacterized protein n=1 Tax=Euplotes crassus TaxID=5936 RepID=A0AAD1XQ15_EUPCR|nr:unnamed protein product [Moneuplotes crassus]
MVKRESKYKTNKKISKNTAFAMNTYICEAEINHKYFPWWSGHKLIPDDQKIIKEYNQKSEIPTIEIYTDNSHYEVVDKKSQRKKKNRTKKKLQDYAKQECIPSQTSCEELVKYKVQTVKDQNDENPQADINSEEYGYQQKMINKEKRKKNKKTLILEGNINHSLNHVDAPDTFEFSKKELSRFIVKGAGTNNTLVNANYWLLGTSSKHKARFKAQQKNTLNKIIANEKNGDIEYKGKIQKVHRFNAFSNRPTYRNC